MSLMSTGAIGPALPLGHARTRHLTDPFFLSLLGFMDNQLVERGYDILLSRVIPDSAQLATRTTGRLRPSATRQQLCRMRPTIDDYRH
jgi:hypothetical protein